MFQNAIPNHQTSSYPSHFPFPRRIWGGEWINAGTLVPPSQSVAFCPFKGVFDPPKG